MINYRTGRKTLFFIINKMISFVFRLDLIFSAVFLCLIVVLSGYGVFVRYVLNSPSAWVEELCLLFFIWFVFLGASVLFRQSELVSVDLIHSLIKSNKLEKVVLFLSNFIVFIFILFFIYLGFKLLPYSQVRYTAALNISYIYIHSAIPVGGIFMLLGCIKKVIKYKKN